MSGYKYLLTNVIDNSSNNNNSNNNNVIEYDNNVCGDDKVTADASTIDNAVIDVEELVTDDNLSRINKSNNRKEKKKQKSTLTLSTDKNDNNYISSGTSPTALCGNTHRYLPL